MPIKLTKLSYNFALHFYCVLFETELRETYRTGKEWNFPCFSFLSQKLLRELNLGALEMLSVTLWRRRSFFCYFCSLETPSAPSIFLPCCESPVNRFLSMFVGNMLSWPPGCRARDLHSVRLTSCGSYRSNKLPLSPPGVFMISRSPIYPSVFFIPLFMWPLLFYTCRQSDFTIQYFSLSALVCGQVPRSFQWIVLLHRAREGRLGEVERGRQEKERERRTQQNVNTSCRGQAVLLFGISKEVIYKA